MTRPLRVGKINVKVIVIIVTVVLALVAAAFVASRVRKQIISERALVEARQAAQDADWAKACKRFRVYLSKHPSDANVWEEYAKAHLEVRPLEGSNIVAAMEAYRRLIGIKSDHSAAYERLASLYTSLEKHGELLDLARKRLQNIPGDPRATIWLSRALLAGRTNESDIEADQVLRELIERLDRQTAKQSEYFEACRGLSKLSMRGNTDSAETRALKAKAWLDRGVQYDPNLPGALLYRGRFLREQSDALGLSREAMLAAARPDLERAGELAQTPLTHLTLSNEWLLLGDLDKAAEELQQVSDADRESVLEHLGDWDDWLVMRFLQTVKLSLQNGTVAQCSELADQTLASLKFPRHRMPVLETAIGVYVADSQARLSGDDSSQEQGRKRVADARKALDEYVGSAKEGQYNIDADSKIAHLRVGVIRLEDHPDKWYRIIRIIRLATTDETRNPALRKLLAEALNRTGQSQLAIREIGTYLQAAPQDRAASLQLVDEYMNQRKWAAALTAAQAFERNEPENVDLRLRRIEAELRVVTASRDRNATTRIAELRDELDKTRASNPERVEIANLQAAAATMSGDPAAAEELLTSAISDRPNILSLRIRLAQVLARAKPPRLSEAVDVCRAAIDKHSDRAAPWSMMAELLEAQGKPDQAIATLRKGIAPVTDASEKKDLQIRLALAQIKAGDRESGIDSLRKLAASDPDDVRTRSLLLQISEVLRQQDQAQKLIDEIRQTQGEPGLLWRVHQARLWLNLTDWTDKRDQIASALNSCLKADPGWAAPALLLGELDERKGDLTRAEAVYRGALQANPAAVDVANRLVLLLNRQERYRESLEVLAHIQADPGRLSGMRIRAAIGAGEVGQVVDELQKRVAQNPDDPDARLLLARATYVRTQDAEQALKLLDEAEKLAPDSLAPTAARVAILHAENRSEEILQILDAAVAKTNTFDAYLLRGNYLARTGDTARAEADYLQLCAIGREGAGYEVLARFYGRSNRADDAITTTEKGVEQYPDNPFLKEQLVRLLLARDVGDGQNRASRMLSELLKAYPDNPRLQLLHAWNLLHQGTAESTREGRTILENIVRRNPTQAEAHLGLIQAAMQGRDYSLARELANRALQVNPNDASLLLERARAEYFLENYGMAGELAQSVLRRSPGNVQAHRLLIDAAAATGDVRALRQQQQLLEQAVTSDPTDVQLHLALSRAIEAAGDIDLAISRLEAFAQTPSGKQSVEVLLQLSELHRGKGAFDESQKHLARAQAVGPIDFAILKEEILLLAARSQFDRIVQLASASKKDSRQYVGVLTTAADVLDTSGRSEYLPNARDLYGKVLEVVPQSVAIKLRLASLAYRTGQTPRSQRLYGEVLQVAPTNVRALNDLAWILAEAHQDYASALPLADRGVQIAPRDHHLRDTRAFILSHMPARMKDAQTDYAKCVELTADDPAAQAGALVHLAEVCAKLGQTSAARTHLQRALQVDSTFKVFDEKKRSEVQQTLNSLPAS